MNLTCHVLVRFYLVSCLLPGMVRHFSSEFATRSAPRLNKLSRTFSNTMNELHYEAPVSFCFAFFGLGQRFFRSLP